MVLNASAKIGQNVTFTIYTFLHFTIFFFFISLKADARFRFSAVTGVNVAHVSSRKAPALEITPLRGRLRELLINVERCHHILFKIKIKILF